MPTNYEPLVLTIDPTYVGSAVSPTVDITETSEDVTVTITDFRGEHSYTVEKTDQAIADAEAAAANANAAATNADTKGQQAVDIATTAANNANAKAELADAAALNANTKAALADSKAALADTAAANADSKAAAANTAANTANTSASNADAKATAAQNAANAANSSASAANTAASNADAKAALANMAATNADNKAALADAAATNANTKAGLAGEAATAANTAAAAADAAREAIQGDLVAKADVDGYYKLLGAGTSDSLFGETETLVTLPHVSEHDGAARIISIRGNTIVDAGSLLSVNVEGVKAVRFNQLNPANILADIFINGRTGKIGVSTGACTAVVEVFPNTDYCLTYDGGNRCVIGGVGSINPVLDDDVSIIFSNASTRVSPKVFNTGNNRYVACFVATSAAPASNICVNISDPSRNGTYEPYRGQTREVPASTYFPNGMRGAGSVYDELTSDKAVTRIGAVDLGTLTWSIAPIQGQQDTNRYYTPVISGIVKGIAGSQVPNIVCSKYQAITVNSLIAANKGIAVDSAGNVTVYDDALKNVSTADFKTAMSGVYLFYELATPTETAINPPLNMTYNVEQGGTEAVTVPTGEMTAPVPMAICYGYTAEGLRDESMSIVAPIENYKASTNYAQGSYLVHEGKLYKVTVAIASGETITPGTNCTQTTVMAELVALTA